MYGFAELDKIDVFLTPILSDFAYHSLTKYDNRTEFYQRGRVDNYTEISRYG
jgi:hypothetical protein